MDNLKIGNELELPDEIVEKIISYVDDLNDFRCHTCVKKISSMDKYIKAGYFKFCSVSCFNSC
jgi:hypothetical protein